RGQWGCSWGWVGSRLRSLCFPLYWFFGWCVCLGGGQIPPPTLPKNRGGGRRQPATATHRPVWPGQADTGPSRKNKTHNNRRVLPLDEYRILCSHRKSGRRSTASVLSPHVRSTGR